MFCLCLKLFHGPPISLLVRVKIFSMHWKGLHSLDSSFLTDFISYYSSLESLCLLRDARYCSNAGSLSFLSSGEIPVPEYLLTAFLFEFQDRLLRRPTQIMPSQISTLFICLLRIAPGCFTFFSLELVTSEHFLCAIYLWCLLFVSSTGNKGPRRQGLCLACSLGYSQYLGEHLAHSRFSINIY